jgi:hypothetical protein
VYALRGWVDLDVLAAGVVAPSAEAVRPRVQQRDPERRAPLRVSIGAATQLEQLLTLERERATDQAQRRDQCRTERAAGPDERQRCLTEDLTDIHARVTRHAAESCTGRLVGHGCGQNATMRPLMSMAR